MIRPETEPQETQTKSSERVEPVKAGGIAGSLFALLAALVLRHYQNTAFNYVQIRAATYYVRAVKAGRSVFISMITVIFGLFLLLAGFIFIHAALFVYLPWSVQSKALLLLILGAVYFVIPLIFIIRATSQRTWMKRSHAANLVSRLTKHS